MKVDIESAYELEKNEEINIDKAVLEHMKSIHDSLLVDKTASIGTDQPSMNSAKLAVKGFIMFLIILIIQAILLDYLSIYFDSKNTSFIKIFVFVIVIMLILCLQFYIGFKTMVSNYHETYYIQNLYFTMPFFPYSSLIVCTVTILFIFNHPNVTIFIFVIEILFFGILFLGNLKRNERSVSQQIERFASETDLNSLYEREREISENSNLKAFWCKLKLKKMNKSNKESYNVLWNNRKKSEIYMSTSSMAHFIQNE